jgi:type II secretory pathway component PulF
MGDRGIYILISWCAGMLVLLILVRICRGGEFMSRIVASLPAFGKLFMWDGYAEFCRFLRLLLNLNVPLPEALLLVSQGMRSQEMAGVVRELAERTRLGTTLSQAMESTGRVPHSVSTVARWGEQTGQLPEALRLTYEMLDGWIRLRADLLRRVLPPLIYIGVGAFVIGAGYTVLAPAMQMIRGISL